MKTSMSMSGLDEGVQMKSSWVLVEYLTRLDENDRELLFSLKVFCEGKSNEIPLELEELWWNIPESLKHDEATMKWIILQALEDSEIKFWISPRRNTWWHVPSLSKKLMRILPPWR